jgi:formate hydrogenlyase subunit 6/NADH:ubiquinone oxidoreductase subunit I
MANFVSFGDTRANFGGTVRSACLRSQVPFGFHIQRVDETPCVSCGRCAETCPVGALMPRPRILETYQLDVSRCIFCGICADACPYDALRCGPEFEFSEYQRDLPMLDILEMSDRERPTR